MGALLGTAAALNKLSGISIRTLTDWCNIFIIIIVMVIVVFINMSMVMMMMMIGRMAQDVGSRQVNRATGRSKVPSNRHHLHYFTFSAWLFSPKSNDFKGSVFITTMITIYRNIWGGSLKPDIHLFWGNILPKIIHHHHHSCHHLQHHGIQWSQKTSENFIHQSSRYFISHKALGRGDSISVCNDLWTINEMRKIIKNVKIDFIFLMVHHR